MKIYDFLLPLSIKNLKDFWVRFSIIDSKSQVLVRLHWCTILLKHYKAWAFQRSEIKVKYVLPFVSTSIEELKIFLHKI